MPMNGIDGFLISLYVGYLVYIGISGKKGQLHANDEYLLSSRKLTLPAFVATLVSTWYGSILAVGEFSFTYGLAQWTVFGLPYYIFAALYAFLIVPKIRNGTFVSLPEAVGNIYGKKGSTAAAFSVFILVNPAPYLLMIGLLIAFFTGFHGFLMGFVVLAAIFSAWYIMNAGFSAVVKTDLIQFGLMFLGFIALFAFSWLEFGSPVELWKLLPENHTRLDGGLSWLYISVWFFIALWTFVDPGFFQRTAAAKTVEVAQKGILTSLIFWTIFDFLTVFCGLYGFAFLSEQSEAALVYPILAQEVLPAGLRGLFYVGILATIMSTLDSFLFLSGQTLARDFFLARKEQISVRRVQMGIWISTGVAIVMVWLVPNVVDLIYLLGSLVVPGLLLTLLGVFFSGWRIQPKHVVALNVIPFLSAATWYVLLQQELLPEILAQFPPFYAGIIAAFVIVVLSKFLTRKESEI